MIKRTFYALTLLLILCVSGIQAQNTKFSKEEFRNRQKEFFIQQAGLSNDEAQKFFPLYLSCKTRSRHTTKRRGRNCVKARIPIPRKRNMAKLWRM